MKSERQLQILRIIAERPIETQNQLIHALREAGVKSTQATVSRDMRELRLVKQDALSLNLRRRFDWVCVFFNTMLAFGMNPEGNPSTSEKVTFGVLV